MCVSPLYIKNPYRGHNKVGIYKNSYWMHDYVSEFIPVPCGVCRECIALKQMYIVQRVQMEALNSFLYFTTLTYSNDFLPHFSCANGVRIPFADITHLQNFFKRLRNDNAFSRPFRYLAVSERGGVKGRPHFHILWFLPRYDGELYSDGLNYESLLHDVIFENWSVNLGSRRVPDYHPLCEYHEKFFRGKLYRNYDTHFVSPSFTSDGVSSVAFYVCKYLMKQNDKERRLQQALRLNLDPVDYDEAWSVVKSRSLRSVHFGLMQTDLSSSLQIVNYLRECVRRSKGEKYPMFFQPDSSLSFPLAPYYKNKGYIFTPSDWMDFHMNDDSVFCDFNKSSTHCFSAVDSFEKMSKIADGHDIGLEFNNLFYGD